MTTAGKVITRNRKPTFVCSRCKKTIDVSHTLVPGYVGGTGYATTFSGKSKRKVCYACCAESDRKFMDKHGKITLYLTTERDSDMRIVINWPGTLRIACYRYWESRNNFGATRTDVWFWRMNSTTRLVEHWHGVHVGSDHELIKCKRLKS